RAGIVSSSSGAVSVPSQYRSGAAAALANRRRTGRPPFTGRALDIVLTTEASPGPSHAWSAIHTLPGAERSRVCPRRVRSSVTTAPIPISIGQAAPAVNSALNVVRGSMRRRSAATAEAIAVTAAVLRSGPHADQTDAGRRSCAVLPSARLPRREDRQLTGVMPLPGRPRQP